MRDTVQESGQVSVISASGSMLCRQQAAHTGMYCYSELYNQRLTSVDHISAPMCFAYCSTLVRHPDRRMDGHTHTRTPGLGSNEVQVLRYNTSLLFLSTL